MFWKRADEMADQRRREELFEVTKRGVNKLIETNESYNRAVLDTVHKHTEVSGRAKAMMLARDIGNEMQRSRAGLGALNSPRSRAGSEKNSSRFHIKSSQSSVIGSMAVSPIGSPTGSPTGSTLDRRKSSLRAWSDIDGSSKTKGMPIHIRHKMASFTITPDMDASPTAPASMFAARMVPTLAVHPDITSTSLPGTPTTPTTTHTPFGAGVTVCPEPHILPGPQ
jgi:hypothetical protein